MNALYGNPNFDLSIIAFSPLYEFQRLSSDQNYLNSVMHRQKEQQKIRNRRNKIQDYEENDKKLTLRVLKKRKHLIMKWLKLSMENEVVDCLDNVRIYFYEKIAKLIRCG
jgi:hypothetical protein